MVAINTIQDDGGQKRSRTGASRRIYTSRSIAVEAANAGSVIVPRAAPKAEAPEEAAKAA